MTTFFSRIWRFCSVSLAGAAMALPMLASAQTVTGAFSPASVGASTASTLTLSYTGFTSDSVGMNLRVYYNSTAVTLGAVAYNNPPGQSQPITSAQAGTLAGCTGADTFIIMNWVDFGGTWPTPTAGTLGTVGFTTSAGFSANTSVCWVEDLTQGAVQRNIAGNATLARTITPSTAVFSISTPVNVTEGGATANATVTCTGAFASNTTTPVTVAYTTTNAAGNFTTTASPLSFTACGGQTRTITVTPRADDAVVQGAVAGSIVLGAITTDVGATIGTGTAVVNVADNDSPPVFGVTKSGACAEPTTSCEFQIVRESGVSGSFTVGFTVSGTATRGTDYTLNDTTCGGPVIAGNSVSHSQAAPAGAFRIAVCPIDDVAVEGVETVVLTLNAGAGYTLGAVATQSHNIADDDSPQVVTVAVSGSPASENGGVLTYTFTRSGGSAAAQAATLAVNVTPPAASARYTTTCAATVTFAAATPTVTCTATGVNNAALDGNINVIVGVAAPTVAGSYTVGSPATATGVITDDEVGVSVAAVSGVVNEGGLVTFTVSCTGMASTSVPFTLTGTIGTDVVGGATSPIALTCGTPQTVTVQTVNNSIQGDNRSITLTLGTPVGGNAALVPGSSAATVAILDDDGPKIVPTMGMLGLGLMSLMLAGLAAFQRRRSLK